MIELKRLPGYDVNGNPRYVCHYLNLLTKSEGTGMINARYHAIFGGRATSNLYALAVSRAHKIGGRKYHTKTYGGGIVFADYENVIRRNIERVVAEAEQAEQKEN